MHLHALTSYLQGLRENNNKAWFVMNKPAYDILRAEYIVLVGDVLKGLAKKDPLLYGLEPKKALFRIYRDIRFSNDKTPYKTYFSASMADADGKHSGPMYYMSTNADGRLHMGAGVWLPQKDVLAQIRRHIVADHATLIKLTKAKRFVQAFGALSREDTLARLPKGYDPAMPGLDRFGDLLRLKSFVVGRDIDLVGRDSTDLASTIVDTFTAALPLNTWLRHARRA